MILDWRELLRRMPESALINVEEYAAELDAVDASVQKSAAAHGGRTFISPFGWGDPIVKDSLVVGIDQRPIAPIPSADPARIAVAVLQRLHFSAKALFHDDPADETTAMYVLLAMADRLLKRRLRLSPPTARDLVRLVDAPPITSAHPQGFGYLSQILKQLERAFSPPVPAAVGTALKGLHTNLSRPTPREPWERRKAPRVSKSRQNACRRIERLLGE